MQQVLSSVDLQLETFKLAMPQLSVGTRTPIYPHEKPILS